MNEIVEKNKGGRPTKYKEEYNKLAFKHCKLGATDKQLAEFFEVTESTINEWKLGYPKFSESIREGKDYFDSHLVEKALFHSALGYSHEAEKIMVCDKEVVREPYVERFPPNPTSLIFWLKNRQPGRWKDKQEHELSGTIGVTPVLNYGIKDK